MGSKFIEQKHYAEKNKHMREREGERERESNNWFEILSLRIGRETIR